MKLPFGIYKGNFIHISEVESGRTDVLCPYCQQTLIAKKGRIKRHHFAHDGQSCVQYFSNNFFALQEKLPTHLPLSVYAREKKASLQTLYKDLAQKHAAITQNGKEKEEMITQLMAILNGLKKGNQIELIDSIINQVNRFIQHKIAPFPAFHLIRTPQFSMDYTDGKTTCEMKELSNDFHEYFYRLDFVPYVKFLKNYHQKENNQNEIFTKLALFNQDLAYFNQFDLYFVEILADHKIMFKIGLTSRDLSIRMKEIEQDLKQHFLAIELKLLFHQKGVAFLETFFKHKFVAYQLKIGQLTEYFTFSKEMLVLLLNDFKLLIFLDKSLNRSQKAWIDWIFFNFNGKIYGHQQKSVYVKNTKYILTEREDKALQTLLELQKQGYK